MMRCCKVAPFLGAVMVAAGAFAGDDGFVLLFPNDGPPTGWVVRAWNDLSESAGPDTEWSVKSGVLQAGAKRGTWLMSEREYSDFILEFSIKLTERGNSGVALRAPMKGDPAFDGFDREGGPVLDVTTMTEYREGWPYPVAFPPKAPDTTIAEVVAGTGGRQLHVAETEKYAHVTYFFNGGREEPFPGEERVLVPSPQHVATYDEAPEMSAAGIRDAVVAGLAGGRNAFLVINFANADMVGHTGVIPAAVRGIEAVDLCMSDIRQAVRAAGGLLVVTADHGNSEVMLEPDGSPNTAHTTNPVPLWIDRPGLRLREGKLGDVGPTACALMGWTAPPVMTGDVLLEG